ncbi:MAG TPA: A24 family peptidase [Acidimicrobiia bacterium]|nr:A24 family peptidase [Acidimicrobiia bacterium]
MPLALAAVSAVVGVFAARMIVAEADAHRLGLPDRWISPLCECGATLGPALIRCSAPDRHRQRPANAAILGSTIVLLAFLPGAVPSLWVLPAYAAFVVGSILLTVTDLDTRLIPNRILVRYGGVGAILLAIGGLFAMDLGALLDAVVGAAAYFGVMFGLALLARGALGYGDVKLAALIGLFVGYLGWRHVVTAAISAFVVAGLVALVLLATRLAGRKDAIAFGPFMVAGGFIALYLGDAVIAWYVR